MRIARGNKFSRSTVHDCKIPGDYTADFKQAITSLSFFLSLFLFSSSAAVPRLFAQVKRVLHKIDGGSPRLLTRSPISNGARRFSIWLISRKFISRNLVGAS